MISITERTVPSLLLLAAAVVVATACSNPVVPSGVVASTSSKVASSAAPARPISGVSTSVATLNMSPPAGRCPADHPVLISIDDTLQLSHLGRTEIIQSHCIDFGPGSEPHFLATQATFTAANGDQLYATYTGTITPNIPPTGPPLTANVAVQMTFAGGTGRFANATGELDGAGVQIFFSSATIYYDGWIAY